MNWWNRAMTATGAAYQTWKRVYQDPSSIYAPSAFKEYQGTYNLLWWYYSNQMFDRYNQVSQLYKEKYGLYRNMRMIENPVYRLVEFYAGHIYPGVLTEDGSELPEGVQSAIPFSKDTPDELKSAIAQIWNWSNWQSKKSVLVRYGAALGDVFVEVVDDVERGKVYLDVLWPGFICELDLDKAGNVKEYVMEYRVEVREIDDRGRYQIIDTYMFRKNVDQNDIKIYRDDVLVRATPNPYGFAPAAWIRHKDCGTEHGAPAISSLEKVDDLNGLVSQVGDQIKKAVQNPRLMSTDKPGGIIQYFGNDKRPATSETQGTSSTPSTDQESVLIMTAPADTKVQSLLGDLNLADAGKEIDRLELLVEKTHPELIFYDKLREMDYVSAPGAQQLMGDVMARYYEASSNYDRGVKALCQMGAAIAGFRLNNGDWPNATPQQQKFAPYNLDSYKKGNLDLSIVPRAILASTETEKAQGKQTTWQAVKAAIDAGVPVEMAVEDIAGWTPERIQKLIQARQKEEAEKQAAFEQQQATMQKYSNGQQQDEKQTVQTKG